VYLEELDVLGLGHARHGVDARVNAPQAVLHKQMKQDRKGGESVRKAYGSDDARKRTTREAARVSFLRDKNGTDTDTGKTRRARTHAP
jgi:hypothetical protein